MSIHGRYAFVCFAFTLLLPASLAQAQNADERPRAREAGVIVGVFEPGPLNAITDVEGVRVGHSTVIRDDDIRTGVTAIIPAPGNLYTHPIPAWIHVGNGYGKLIGETQVREFGEIETPVLLVCTLCVWSAANALKEWMYEQPGMGEHTLNPVVGETNDSRVNNMWADPVQRDEVFEALDSAGGGPVAEGSIGAGAGTQAFGWKGGIGTSSRVLPADLGGYTIGVLVQTNYGGVLEINGAPVGRELGNYSFRASIEGEDQDREDGSIMMVVATDAPLDSRGLERLSMRAMMGLGAHRLVREQWVGRLRHRIFGQSERAPPSQQRRAGADRGAGERSHVAVVRGYRRSHRRSDLLSKQFRNVPFSPKFKCPLRPCAQGA